MFLEWFEVLLIIVVVMVFGMMVGGLYVAGKSASHVRRKLGLP